MLANAAVFRIVKEYSREQDGILVELGWWFFDARNGGRGGVGQRFRAGDFERTERRLLGHERKRQMLRLKCARDRLRGHRVCRLIGRLMLWLLLLIWLLMLWFTFHAWSFVDVERVDVRRVDCFKVGVENLLHKVEEIFAQRAIKIEHKRERNFKVKVVVADLLEKDQIFVRYFVRMLGACRLVRVLLYRIAHFYQQPIVELRLKRLAQTLFHFIVRFLQSKDTKKNKISSQQLI